MIFLEYDTARRRWYEGDDNLIFVLVAALGVALAVTFGVSGEREPSFFWELIAGIVAAIAGFLASRWSSDDPDDANSFFLTLFFAAVLGVLGFLLWLLPGWLPDAVCYGLWFTAVGTLLGFLRVPARNWLWARRLSRAHKKYPDYTVTIRYADALKALDLYVAEPQMHFWSVVEPLERLAEVMPAGWSDIALHGSDPGTDAWLTLETRRRVAAVRQAKRGLLMRSTPPWLLADQIGRDLGHWVRDEFGQISAEDDIDDLAPGAQHPVRRQVVKIAVLTPLALAPLAIVWILSVLGVIDESETSAWLRIAIAWAILGIIGLVDHDARNRLTAAKEFFNT